MGLFDSGGVDMGALLGSIRKNQGAAMNDIYNVGAQQAQDIRDEFTSQGNRANQQLQATGLAGSTISPSINALYSREKTSALNRLAETLAQQRATVRGQYAQQQFGALSIPKQPGMGWGLLGGLLGLGGQLGGAFLGRPPGI